MEEVLSGGLLSRVVKVDGTVRRTAHPWSEGVQDLLAHVRQRGFHLAPEPLGFDAESREVLSYIPGETVGWALPWPGWIRSDVLLADVGKALASFHEAVADFRPDPPPRWQEAFKAAGPEMVVCHHDLAPYNVVCRNGRLVGIIDWDLAAPAPPLTDIAFAAWQWVPLHAPAVAGMLGWDPGANLAARLRLFLDAYGLADRDGFIDAVRARILANREVMVSRAASGETAYQALVDQGHVAGMDAALAFLEAVGADLESELSR